MVGGVFMVDGDTNPSLCNIDALLTDALDDGEMVAVPNCSVVKFSTHEDGFFVNIDLNVKIELLLVISCVIQSAIHLCDWLSCIISFLIFDKLFVGLITSVIKKDIFIGSSGVRLFNGTDIDASHIRLLDILYKLAIYTAIK